jgi:hypothetical protein
MKLPNITQERVDALFKEFATKPQLQKEAASDLHAFLSKRFTLSERLKATFGRFSRKQLAALSTHIRKLGAHDHFSIDVKGLSSTSPPISMDRAVSFQLVCTKITIDSISTTVDEAGHERETRTHTSTMSCVITAVTYSWN